MRTFAMFLESKTEEIIQQAKTIVDGLLTASRKRTIQDPKLNQMFEQQTATLLPLVQQILPLDFSNQQNEVKAIFANFYDAWRNLERKCQKRLCDIDSYYGVMGVQRQIYKKLDEYNSPQHHKIVNDDPTNRQNYGIAADYLEDQGEDDYLITIYRAVAQAHPQHLFVLKLKQTFDNRYLFKNDDLTQINLNKQKREILKIDKYFYIRINTVDNSPPNMPYIETLGLDSLCLPNFNHPDNEKETIDYAKNLCARLNKGNYAFYDNFVKDYTQKMIKVNDSLGADPQHNTGHPNYLLKFKQYFS